MRWHKWFEIIGDGLIIFLAIFSLWVFQFLWRYGGVYLHEPNTAILAFETIAAIWIGILGIERAIKDIIQFRRRKKGY